MTGNTASYNLQRSSCPGAFLSHMLVAAPGLVKQLIDLVACYLPL